MKRLSAFSSIVVLGLAACGPVADPVASGDFDPLRPPGNNSRRSSAEPSFSAGQFVRASMDNTAFFQKRPQGDADADKLLKRDTSMKVISSSGNYVKVELDNGEVGFVPSVMLENPNAAPPMPLAAPGEYQIYPPLLGAGEPLPALDPAGLPPEGSIPTVIDPDAPNTGAPVPPVTPTTGTFPAPVAPKVESVPLPPNDE